MSLAAPLALGVISNAELMDIVLTKTTSPHFFTGAVSKQLPPGIEILQVCLVAPTLPSLQSQVRYAEYKVELEAKKEPKEIESSLASLLSLGHLSWQHKRDTGTRNYDLRALVDDLWLINCREGYCTIGMRLRCDSSGAGRPEQVAAALGLTQYPRLVHRTKLILMTS